MNPFTEDQVEHALIAMNIKKHGDEYRLRGFEIKLKTRYHINCIILSGKIPLKLAQSFYYTYKPQKTPLIQIARDHVAAEILSSNRIIDGLTAKAMTNAKKLVADLSIDELYLTEIEIDSIDELRFIIETIRENSYVNEWAYGNK